MPRPAVLAKFDRANQHISDLQREISEWCTDSTALSSELSPNKMTYSLNLVITKKPDLRQWSLIFGDAIHNMRSALDLWAWDRLSAEIRELPTCRNVYFPVRDTSKGFTNWANKARNQGFGEETIGVLETVQPYLADPTHGRNVLEHVHKLDITNKHKHLHDLRVQPEGKEPISILVQGHMQPDPRSDFEIVYHNVDVTEGGTIVEVASSSPLLAPSSEPRISLTPYYVFEGMTCELWGNLRKYSDHLLSLIAKIEKQLPDL